MAEVKAPWCVTIGQMRCEYGDTRYANQRIQLTRAEAAMLAAKLLQFAATPEPTNLDI